MHYFIEKNFVISDHWKKLSQTDVYRGKRKENNQDVLIVDFISSTMHHLQHSINEFIGKLSNSQYKVTDCHVDITLSHIIFALVPDAVQFANDFIQSVSSLEQEMPTRLRNTRIRHSIKIETTLGDDEPDDEHLHHKSFFADSSPQMMGGEITPRGSRRLNTLAFHHQDFGSPMNQGQNSHAKTETNLDIISKDSKSSQKTSIGSPFLNRRPSPFSPDIEKVKELLQADYSSWKLDQNEKNRKVYVRFKDGESKINVRSEAVLLDADIDILARMNMDIDIRREWDGSFSRVQLSEVFSENEDTIYSEMKMPFPLSNRDFVQYRYYVNNYLHPEEIEKKGLWKKKHKYWLFVLQSVSLPAFPARKGVVRAENTTMLLLEEDEHVPRKVHYKLISATDLRGNIPLWVLQNAVGKQAAKVIDHTISAYRKNASKWVAGK